jgi:hypothetical protein
MKERSLYRTVPGEERTIITSPKAIALYGFPCFVDSEKDEIFVVCVMIHA